MRGAGGGVGCPVVLGLTQASLGRGRGVGALAVPPLLVLEQVGLFPGAGAGSTWPSRSCKRRRDRLVADNSPAEQLARRVAARSR